MKKELRVDGFYANVEIKEEGAFINVVITIPFSLESSAEACFSRLEILREVSGEKAPEDIELKEGS